MIASIGIAALGLADSGSALDIRRTTPGTTPGTAPGTTPADTTVYRTVASVIQTGGNPPMIAFVIGESYPPTGGDIVLHDFSWDQLDGEQTESDTTWLDGVELVGQRAPDGGFTLTQPPKLGEPPLSPLTYDNLTPNCDEATFGPMLTKLDTLDPERIGLVSSNEYTFDGHCGVVLTVTFDTPELRTTVDRLLGPGADVSYDPMFQPADQAAAGSAAEPVQTVPNSSP